MAVFGVYIKGKDRQRNRAWTPRGEVQRDVLVDVLDDVL